MDDRMRIRLMDIVHRHLCDSGECHNADHTLRVRDLALLIARCHPGIDPGLLETAAILHDIGRGGEEAQGKSHGEISGELAEKYLAELGYAPEDISMVVQAIVEHPFSRGAVPSHLLGKILQDADRLDALGAIGIARVFLHSPDRPLYDSADPFGENRPHDDDRFTIDHFYLKLLKLPDTLHTSEAKAIGRKRALFMESYLRQLSRELSGEEAAGPVRAGDSSG